MKQPNTRDTVMIDDFLLCCTCTSVPEQWVVLHEGRQVGYLRLRGGKFTAQYPDVEGECVYNWWHPDSHLGNFETEVDRMHHIGAALCAIRRHL